MTDTQHWPSYLGVKIDDEVEFIHARERCTGRVVGRSEDLLTVRCRGAEIQVHFNMCIPIPSTRRDAPPPRYEIVYAGSGRAGVDFLRWKKVGPRCTSTADAASDAWNDHLNSPGGAWDLAIKTAAQLLRRRQMPVSASWIEELFDGYRDAIATESEGTDGD